MPDFAAAAAAFHQSGRRSVLAITGGGSGLIGALLSVPGGSRSVLEAVVPYSLASLQRYLRTVPDRACSEETALAMAAQSWTRAFSESGSDDALGFGMTAALVSNRPKRGEHRVFAAAQTADGTTLVSATLAKGCRTRPEEEVRAVELGFAALMTSAGLRFDPSEVDGDDVRTTHAASHPGVREVRLGSEPYAWVTEPPVTDALLSGSFNPVHAGHTGLRSAAADFLGVPVAYEISLVNADKPPLDDLRLAQRVEQLDGPVVVSAADTFVRKARSFPGTTFVVGFDTAARVLDPRYYAGGLDAALREVRRSNCRFLVAARVGDGVLRTLGDCDIPSEHSDLFRELPATLFREDVSSTAIRAAGGVP